MKRLLIILPLLFWIACDDQKDEDEFSLQGTWVDLESQMSRKNSEVLLFDTNSGSFSYAYVSPSSSADGCYCYENMIYQQVDGDNYRVDYDDLDGGEPLIIEVLESGNISVTFELYEWVEIEFLKQSDNLQSSLYPACEEGSLCS